MTKEKAVYRSYLLRLWREDGNGRWRVRLEQIGEEAQVLHFADLETFVSFLLPTLPMNESNCKGDD